MKVRFLQTRTVQAVDGETFQQGKVYDLPEVSAQRWIARGVAVDANSAAPVLETPQGTLLDKVGKAIGAVTGRKKAPK